MEFTWVVVVLSAVFAAAGLRVSYLAVGATLRRLAAHRAGTAAAVVVVPLAAVAAGMMWPAVGVWVGWPMVSAVAGFCAGRCIIAAGFTRVAARERAKMEQPRR